TSSPIQRMSSDSIRGRISSTFWREEGRGKREDGGRGTREEGTTSSANQILPQFPRPPHPFHPLPASLFPLPYEIRLLASRLRRLATERRGRTDGGVVGVRTPPRAAQ